ncbi:VOC family protein [Erythrobacter sp.]|jgi:catechol 2,3-dioxygenase-like lactoylglutathione lyase family enzyme|uniref:VOC family protein n=1 Tax=Erythrobacter sp. TaxID=1042 RepID=UPI002EBABDF5|nr:VOC family protein [Erythrobacter sp.]
MRRAFVLGAFAFFLAVLTALPSSQLRAQEAGRLGVEPWSEAVVSVAAFEPATRLFRHAGGWRLVASGEMSRGELDYYRLPASVTGAFERWCAPRAETGCIRFVRIDGAERQGPIRPAARAWDTGGIYSIMVRSDDVSALYDKALELGWWAESPPIRFQFGASDLRNVVLTGPHGIHLAVYERITPEFTAFPLGPISQGFNAMRMVRDRASARDFYAEKLGFDRLFDSDREPAEPAFSNFSIPYNLTPQIVRAAAALQPSLPGETGRVEVMQITGFTGRDHSARASLPNFGIVSVRYPVRDIGVYRAFLNAQGVELTYEAQGVTVGTLGRLDMIAVRDPDGNLTEFYQAP